MPQNNSIMLIVVYNLYHEFHDDTMEYEVGTVPKYSILCKVDLNK